MAWILSHRSGVEAFDRGAGECLITVQYRTDRRSGLELVNGWEVDRTPGRTSKLHRKNDSDAEAYFEEPNQPEK